MKPMNGKAGMVARLSLAAGLLGTTALAVASAAPLGPQAGFEADSGLLTHVKKKGKGGKHHHHHGIWTGIGAAIALGSAYCSAQVESCDERYGDDDDDRYQRCLQRAGCDDGDDW